VLDEVSERARELVKNNQQIKNHGIYHPNACSRAALPVFFSGILDTQLNLPVLDQVVNEGGGSTLDAAVHSQSRLVTPMVPIGY
jgi:hypothetical protein